VPGPIVFVTQHQAHQTETKECNNTSIRCILNNRASLGISSVPGSNKETFSKVVTRGLDNVLTHLFGFKEINLGQIFYELVIGLFLI
jgi:hypothetical protein